MTRSVPCGAYLGDNDGTCPQLTCIRDRGHEGAHDNVRGDETMAAAKTLHNAKIESTPASEGSRA